MAKSLRSSRRLDECSTMGANSQWKKSEKSYCM